MRRRQHALRRVWRLIAVAVPLSVTLAGCGTSAGTRASVSSITRPQPAAARTTTRSTPSASDPAPSRPINVKGRRHPREPGRTTTGAGRQGQHTTRAPRPNTKAATRVGEILKRSHGRRSRVLGALLGDCSGATGQPHTAGSENHRQTPECSTHDQPPASPANPTVPAK